MSGGSFHYLKLLSNGVAHQKNVAEVSHGHACHVLPIVKLHLIYYPRTIPILFAPICYHHLHDNQFGLQIGGHIHRIDSSLDFARHGYHLSLYVILLLVFAFISLFLGSFHIFFHELLDEYVEAPYQQHFGLEIILFGYECIRKQH